MRLGIIGAGHIGGNIARLAALAGYDVTVSFARDRADLDALAGIDACCARGKRRCH